VTENQEPTTPTAGHIAAAPTTPTGKHTPGPWRNLSDPFEDGTPYYRIIGGAGYHDDASDTGFEATAVMSDADAALMAAAPLLLVALALAQQFVLAEYEVRLASHRRTDPESKAPELDEDGQAVVGEAKAILDIIDAAIAAALGQSADPTT